ncbi:MAG: glutathione peroxidase [Bacteroidales bacterium]|nr:glutathione peroxidase [Bacteroidales bacterium]
MKHLKFMAVAMAAVVLIGSCKQKSETPVEQNNDNIYQFTVLDGTDNEVSLATLEGKVVLVVNTATECGFTPQYEELQALYKRYRSEGFEVLDFPCNQFGAQAPGSNEEIHAFCTGTYNVTFPQMAKIDVNGDSATSLYTWLKAKAPFCGFDTTDPRGAYLDKMFRAQDPDYDRNDDIKWNFTKFLVDREGNVVARFEPTAPMTAVAEAVKALL